MKPVMTMTLTPAHAGVQTALIMIGIRIPAVHGFILIAAGAGIHATRGARTHAITEDGGGQPVGDGFGLPVICGLRAGFRGVTAAITGAGTRFRQG